MGLVFPVLQLGRNPPSCNAPARKKRFDDVRRLAHSLMFEIDDSVKDLQGATPTRQLIVSRALEYLDSLASQAADNPTLQRELATAYEKIGDIQGNPYSHRVTSSARAASRLGADETRSTERTKDWHEAHFWFPKALDLFSELGKRGTLMPADTGRTAKFAAKIQECDEAIAELEK